MKNLIYDVTLNDKLPKSNKLVEDVIKKPQEHYYQSLEALIKAICEHEKCSPLDLQMNVETNLGNSKIWFSKKDKDKI